MHAASLLLLFSAGVALASPLATTLEARHPEAEAVRGCTLKRESPEYCAGTAYNESAMHLYLCGDIRLGPRKLPTKVPVDTLVETYNRLGGLCPGKFIETWWNTSASPEAWKWPPLDGFSADNQGNPIKGNMTLEKGLVLDRFGGTWGKFVSPAAAPYMQRALPPYNLATQGNDDKFPNNYYMFRVLKPFSVLAGPILPWFGQPGQGVQYQLDKRIFELLDQGFLEIIDPELEVNDPEDKMAPGKANKSWMEKIFGKDL